MSSSVHIRASIILLVFSLRNMPSTQHVRGKQWQ